MEMLWLRRSVTLAMIASFIAVAVVLLLSDRVGPAVDALHDLIVRAGQRVERVYGVDVVDRSDVPGSTDQMGHAALWGSGMLLFGWAFRKRVPVLISAIFVTAASLLSEIVQPILSTTRQLQPSDAMANLVGIGSAAAFLLAVLWAFPSLTQRHSR